MQATQATRKFVSSLLSFIWIAGTAVLIWFLGRCAGIIKAHKVISQENVYFGQQDFYRASMAITKDSGLKCLKKKSGFTFQT